MEQHRDDYTINEKIKGSRPGAEPWPLNLPAFPSGNEHKSPFLWNEWQDCPWKWKDEVLKMMSFIWYFWCINRQGKRMSSIQIMGLERLGTNPTDQCSWVKTSELVGLFLAFEMMYWSNLSPYVFWLSSELVAIQQAISGNNRMFGGFLRVCLRGSFYWGQNQNASFRWVIIEPTNT